ncbi:MAG TPA: M50 family metallopeptidase [Thermoanaerobaculia bacterium]|nr:M50 family metallopeptidase [Thermoanaerobaculia bacterium]
MQQPDDRSSGFRLGSIAGTSIHIEVTFLILMGLFVILDVERGLPIQRALLWIPILLISVLFHELGHAALIALFGFGRSTIVLGGFGGVTINRRQTTPWKEIVISLAGPTFSLLLAILLIVAWRSVPFLRGDPMLAAMIPLMVLANQVWAVFNLVPIYPLDGGQALQNLARFFTRERTAAFLSIWISIVLGAGILALALWLRQFFLAIIAAMLAMQNFQRWQIWRGWKDPSP